MFVCEGQGKALADRLKANHRSFLVSLDGKGRTGPSVGRFVPMPYRSQRGTNTEGSGRGKPKATRSLTRRSLEEGEPHHRTT
jgi:hypothetical protein